MGRWGRHLEPPIEPSPKTNFSRIGEKSDWKATSVLKDVRLTLTCSKPFDKVLEDRRTRRVFSPVDLRETRAFIQHVFVPRQIGRGRLAGLSRKTIISAGALHPLEVIITDGKEVDEPLLFSDKTKRFLTLAVLNKSKFDEAIADAKCIVPSAEGHMLLFVGDKRRVAKVYEAPESLLWRDGGAAMQACSMAACAYDYAFCPLGYTGTAVLNALGPPHKEFVATGLAVFGR